MAKELAGQGNDCRGEGSIHAHNAKLRSPDSYGDSK